MEERRREEGFVTAGRGKEVLVAGRRANKSVEVRRIKGQRREGF